MNKLTVLLLFTAGAVNTAVAQDLSGKFDAAAMTERVKRLAADDFEGRGPGTDGGRRAARYIADQLRGAGVSPAGENGYLQNVKLVGVKAAPASVLSVNSAGGREDFRFGDDFVATTGSQSPDVSADAEIVFAGYGISSPLYKWNDYSGPASDYRGKILVILVNDPPASAAEPLLFGAKALTYFGRWTYKYEEAARRGWLRSTAIHSTGC